MTLLKRKESNILNIVLWVDLVFELSELQKHFLSMINENVYIDLQMCQFILKVVVSASILLFWFVK